MENKSKDEDEVGERERERALNYEKVFFKKKKEKTHLIFLLNIRSI